MIDRTALRKQWERSSTLGFFRRLMNYAGGQECYSCNGGRLRLTKQTVTPKTGVYEQWDCDTCSARLGELY